MSDGQQRFLAACILCRSPHLGDPREVCSLLFEHLPDNDIGFLVESLDYTVGFLVVIMARQQLFTENTVTAVLPVMSQPRIGRFRR